MMNHREFCQIISPPSNVTDHDLVERFTTTRSRGREDSTLALVHAGSEQLTALQREEMSICCFLHDVGLCQREQRCKNDRNMMAVRWCSVGDRFKFVCPKCKANKNMFRNTFLDGRKMGLWKMLTMLWRLTEWRGYTQRSIAALCDLDEHTVGQWCIWVREALSIKNGNQLITLGGPDKTVYIDEVREDLPTPLRL